MGIKFGEVDATQILENEFRIGVLEALLDGLLSSNPGLNKPNQDQIKQIRKNVIKKLQEKYPNSGLEYKESE